MDTPPPCPGCQTRDRRIAALEAQVADLQQQLLALRRQRDELQRSQHRQATPFRRRQRAKKPQPPGRPAGHPPAHRPPPDHVDQTVAVPLPACPHCQGPVQEKTVHVQYQTDLPPVRPVVTRFDLEAGWCPHCRCRVQARHPEQISDAVGAAANQLGPRTLALAAELKHRLGVPFRKITDLLVTYWQLPVSHSALVRACHRLARWTQPAYLDLIERLRRAEVVHADETGWRIGGRSAWLWVFSGGPATVYLVTPGRGHDVPERVLGPDCAGYLVCDGAKAYDALEDYLKSRCLSHVLRRCHDLQEAAASPARAADVAELQTLLQEAIDLGERRAALTAVGYHRRVQEIERRLDAWLFNNRRRRSAEVERLVMHLCSHRGELLVFLHQPAVPPTNNHAEQMLRPAVISRTIGGCNQTEAGAETHSVLSSILVTAKRLGHSFLDLAVGWLRQGQAPALPPGPLPSPIGP
ncbi:MAG: IS66 family transposase [Planctomycetia bacterium]|nr:IS66 family transposase [Planctomycetia bacterium]